MSEFHAEPFQSLPGWTQQMIVLPDLVCIDARLWVSSNRGKWSMCTQVATGRDRELQHLAVGPDMPFETIGPLSRAVESQTARLLAEFVEPFPLRSA